MSRTDLLEKIKQAEASASTEIDKAEKEQISAKNRMPLDHEELISKERKSAEKNLSKESRSSVGDERCVAALRSPLISFRNFLFFRFFVHLRGAARTALVATAAPFSAIRFLKMMRGS